jgi:hypothetical protein
MSVPSAPSSPLLALLALLDATRCGGSCGP